MNATKYFLQLSERIFLLIPFLDRGLRELWLIIAKLTEQTPSHMVGLSLSCLEPFSGHGYWTCSFIIKLSSQRLPGGRPLNPTVICPRSILFLIQC